MSTSITACPSMTELTSTMQASVLLQASTAVDAMTMEVERCRNLQVAVDRLRGRNAAVGLPADAARLADIDKVKFEIEGMRNDLKRKQEEMRSAENRREEAEQVRDDARKLYRDAARSSEKTRLVLSAQKLQQIRQQNKRADAEIDEFSEQSSVRHRGMPTNPEQGEGD